MEKAGRIRRVVIITQDFFPDIGGITTWCAELAKNILKSGIDVRVIAKTPESAKSADDYEYEVIRLDSRRWKNRKYRLIGREIARFDPAENIFLCANWKMALPCMFRSFSKKIRYFTAVHGMDALEGRRLNRLLQKNALRRASGVIPVSRYTAGLLDVLNLDRYTQVEVINNGVDTERFTPGPKSPEIADKYSMGAGFNIISLGRLVRRKGFDMTIRALRHMKNKDVRYIIAGKGPYEKELHFLAGQLGMLDKVHFAGFVADKDLVDFYRSGDIFCMPSRMRPLDVEGFGITYLEAAACGTPSIGGLGSGAEDAIVDGETGLLVDPDSPQEIAKALDKLYENRLLLQRKGENAAKRAHRDFRWQTISDRLMNFMMRNS